MFIIFLWNKISGEKLASVHSNNFRFPWKIEHLHAILEKVRRFVDLSEYISSSGTVKSLSLTLTCRQME